MPTTNLNFAAQVSDWVKETEARMLAVRNQAADDVIDQMRKFTPVDFGFLAGTIQGSLNTPVPIDRSATNENKAHVAPDASSGQVSLVIAGSDLNDTIFGCFTMAYAGYVNYGTSKMAPRAMVERSAAMWPKLVEEACTKAKARAG